LTDRDHLCALYGIYESDLIDIEVINPNSIAAGTRQLARQSADESQFNELLTLDVEKGSGARTCDGAMVGGDSNRQLRLILSRWRIVRRALSEQGLRWFGVSSEIER